MEASSTQPTLNQKVWQLFLAVVVDDRRVLVAEALEPQVFASTRPSSSMDRMPNFLPHTTSHFKRDLAFNFQGNSFHNFPAQFCF